MERSDFPSLTPFKWLFKLCSVNASNLNACAFLFTIVCRALGVLLPSSFALTSSGSWRRSSPPWRHLKTRSLMASILFWFRSPASRCKTTSSLPRARALAHGRAPRCPSALRVGAGRCCLHAPARTFAAQRGSSLSCCFAVFKRDMDTSKWQCSWDVKHGCHGKSLWPGQPTHSVLKCSFFLLSYSFFLLNRVPHTVVRTSFGALQSFMSPVLSPTANLQSPHVFVVVCTRK